MMKYALLLCIVICVAKSDSEIESKRKSAAEVKTPNNPGIITVKYQAKRMDLSGTKFVNAYCTYAAKIRVNNATTIARTFAATVHQCHSRCNRNIRCSAVEYYHRAKICEQTTADKDTGRKSSSSANALFLRRVKGQKECPSGSAPFIIRVPPFSKSFCLVKGKTCTGTALYRRPLAIADIRACMHKCAKIKLCGAVSYLPNKCVPLAKGCNPANLKENKAGNVGVRLMTNKKTCPSGFGVESEKVSIH